MEGAGLAVGVLALAGLFNNAVDCFEYVQLGRDFKQDFTTCSLQLDCARLQLSRWGASIGLEKDALDESAVPANAAEDEIQEARELLTQIIELFNRAKETSEKYNDRARRKGKQLEICSAEDDGTSIGLSLHQKMRKMCLSRQGVKDLVQKTKWALHEESRFRTLIGDIKSLVSELVELFPASASRQQKLCDTEANELAGDAALPILVDIATDQDELLSHTLAKLVAKDTSTYNISFADSTNYGMQIGHASGSVHFQGRR